MAKTPDHRMKMSGMDVQEQEKHGRDMAYDRYNNGNPPKYYEGAPYPKDQTRSEDKGSRMSKVGAGDVGAGSWLRGSGRGGEGNPNFSPTPSGKNRGGRKSSPGY
jgi:hypothetical protein